MARIRSIKPEFFDHEQLCALSPWHRLCFAGLWTQADKAGRMEDRPARLKARIFPYDDLDMERLLTDLTTHGFIVRYEVDGRRYIGIPEASWAEHQRPRADEHESVLPPIDSGTVTNSSLRSDEPVPSACDSVTHKSVGSREKGVGNREEEVGVAALAALAAPTVRRASDLAELWNHVTAPPIPRCRDMTLKRKQKAAKRLAERPFAEWQAIFERIQASDFCRGQTDSGTWVASFDWIITNPDNAVKVLEGKYDNRQRAPVKAAVSPERFGQRETDILPWVTECVELHGGKCKNSEQHAARMANEAA